MTHATPPVPSAQPSRSVGGGLAELLQRWDAATAAAPQGATVEPLPPGEDRRARPEVSGGSPAAQSTSSADPAAVTSPKPTPLMARGSHDGTPDRFAITASNPITAAGNRWPGHGPHVHPESVGPADHIRDAPGFADAVEDAIARLLRREALRHGLDGSAP